jgi:hypothetical protein
MEPAPAATAAVLAGLAALHVAWGRGSSFPLSDAEHLSDAVAGSTSTPPPAACYAVAGALTAASALVAGAPRRGSWLQRTGTTVVAGVFAGRALLGFTGRTDLVAPGGTTSERFRELDRTRYSPLCALIAVGSLLARR